MSLKEDSERLRNSVLTLREKYQQLLDQALEDEADAVSRLRSKASETDRSENAVYQAAYKAYMKAQSDIALYTNKCNLIDNFNQEYKQSMTIGVKSTVSFSLNVNSDKFPKDYIMLVVPEGLGIASKNLLDITSPLGSAIYKHKAGDVVDYMSLSGIRQVHIKEIY